MVELVDIRQRRTKATQFIDSPLVKIIVGKEGAAQTSYFVHEDLLTERSGFFQSALNGSWAESDTKTVFLPDDDDYYVKLYIELLYTGKLGILRPKEVSHADESDKRNTEAQDDIGDSGEKEVKDQDQEGGVVESGGTFEMLKLYVLAEKFIDPRAKNHIMHGLVSSVLKPRADGKHYCPTDGRRIEIIYNGTASATNPARRFLIDIYHKSGSSTWFNSYQAEDLPKDFLHELAVKFLDAPRSKKTGPPPLLDVNDYLEDTDLGEYNGPSKECKVVDERAEEPPGVE
ncbi:hypothetical protein BDV95DRAFT_609441 [Massariosphaeria phaeospora]|uniref:BTB domain-containing protein n=1 Tax=Massariosphaeria phaeospora TaxID=100035 RepID=A0A7C8I697_9PLEO|nr:hypothetical protein BDV95DRAFT_609441 [Massariosphaeria phaeospora]